MLPRRYFETKDHLGADMMAPVIETERMILRKPMATDEPVFAKFLMSDRAQFVGGPTTRGRAWRAFAHLVGQWEMRGYGVLTMLERGTRAVIGSCGYFHPAELPEPEISWSIWDIDFEGRGLATEAALACRSHAYAKLGWRTVTSNIDVDNARSIALAERLGCRIEKTYVEETPEGTFDVHQFRHPGPERTA